MKCPCCNHRIPLLSLLGATFGDTQMEFQCGYCGGHVAFPWALVILLPIVTFVWLGFVVYTLFYRFDLIQTQITILLTLLFLAIFFTVYTYPLTCVRDKKETGLNEGAIVVKEKNMDKALLRLLAYLFLLFAFILSINTALYLFQKELDLNIIKIIAGMILMVCGLADWVLYTYVDLFWKQIHGTVTKVTIYHRMSRLYQDHDDYELICNYSYRVEDKLFYGNNHMFHCINYEVYDQKEDALKKANQAIKDGVTVYIHPNNTAQSIVLIPIKANYKLLYGVLVCMGVLLLVL